MTRSFVRVALLSTIAMAPILASTLTLKSTDIGGTFVGDNTIVVPEGVVNGIDYTDLTFSSNGSNIITITGIFTCVQSSACVSSTFYTVFNGSGFNVGDPAIGTLNGITSANSGFQGNFGFYVDGIANGASIVAPYNGGLSFDSSTTAAVTGSNFDSGRAYFRLDNLNPGSSVTLTAGDSLDIAPEPGTLALSGIALLSLSVLGRGTRRRAVKESAA